MAFDVPMMIGGGRALHSARSMRQLIADFLYASEGVLLAADCRVLPLPAPDDSVRVSPGGVAILNRALGANGREAYYDYNDQDILVPIEHTGSAGGRSDLIVAKIEDPHAAGSRYQKPSNEAEGPYIRIEVIRNVSRTVYTVRQLAAWQSETALTLARVDQPASNSTITASMIVDLRSIANGPQRYQEPDPPPDPPPPPVDENPWTESHPQLVQHTLQYTDRSFVNWPSSANWRVPIPKWANGVDIQMRVQNPYHCDHLTGGDVRVGVGAHWGTPMPWDGEAKVVPSNWPRCVLSPYFTNVWTRPDRNPIDYSTTLAFAGAYKSYPGTIQTVRVQARMTDASYIRGRVVADTSTVVWLFLNFKTKPEIN